MSWLDRSLNANQIPRARRAGPPRPRRWPIYLSVASVGVAAAVVLIGTHRDFLFFSGRALTTFPLRWPVSRVANPTDKVLPQPFHISACRNCQHAPGPHHTYGSDRMNPACWPDVPAMMAELSAEPRVEVMISPYRTRAIDIAECRSFSLLTTRH